MIRFDQCKLEGGERGGGGGEGFPEKDEARVAINPSILQRFLGSGYYYMDDVSIPYATILGEERLLLPSQQQALLSKTEEGSDNALFGHLWIRFCARLAQTQDDFYHQANIQWFLVILALAWLVMALITLANTFTAAMLVEECTVFSFLIMSGFSFVLMACPLQDLATHVLCLSHEHEDKIQQLVDEMALLFQKEGVHVDMVHDKRRFCPSLIYIRFQRDSKRTSDTTNTSLADTMMAWQRKAVEEHEEVLIARHQRKLARRGIDFPCLQIVAKFEGAIKVVAAAAAIFYAFSIVLVSTGIGYLLL